MKKVTYKNCMISFDVDDATSESDLDKLLTRLKNILSVSSTSVVWKERKTKVAFGEFWFVLKAQSRPYFMLKLARVLEEYKKKGIVIRYEITLPHIYPHLFTSIRNYYANKA